MRKANWEAEAHSASRSLQTLQAEYMQIELERDRYKAALEYITKGKSIDGKMLERGPTALLFSMVAERALIEI